MIKLIILYYFSIQNLIQPKERRGEMAMAMTVVRANSTSNNGPNSLRNIIGNLSSGSSSSTTTTPTGSQSRNPFLNNTDQDTLKHTAPIVDEVAVTSHSSNNPFEEDSGDQVKVVSERIDVFLTRSCVQVTDISCGVMYKATSASLVLFRSYC